MRAAIAWRTESSASTTPLAEIDGTFDLVVANILAPELIALASDLQRVTAAGGTLVVSGVLAGRYDHVLAALAPMEVVGVDELDGGRRRVARQRCWHPCVDELVERCLTPVWPVVPGTH